MIINININININNEQRTHKMVRHIQ